MTIHRTTKLHFRMSMKNQQLKQLTFLAIRMLNKVSNDFVNVLERGPFNARRQTATNNEELN